jgi:hypothetical protein
VIPLLSLGAMLRDKVLADLSSMSPEAFVASHIFDRCPAVFQSRDDFIKWKLDLARRLDVDAASITLVGSAAVGISLNPNKSFREFDQKSDVDVAVISQYHFQVAWRYLRANGKDRYKLSPRQKNAWDDHVQKLIFWGTIATDKLLPIFPFARAWAQAALEASKVAAIADREVKFRIYADYEALRSYQVRSVKSSRDTYIAEQVV